MLLDSCRPAKTAGRLSQHEVARQPAPVVAPLPVLEKTGGLADVAVERDDARPVPRAQRHIRSTGPGAMKFRWDRSARPAASSARSLAAGGRVRGVARDGKRDGYQDPPPR